MFASSGTYLVSQIETFKKSLKGNYWPLIDGRKNSNYPKRIILFFYEGNDLDNYDIALNRPAWLIMQKLYIGKI
tara:strand:- start:167 stop:388 length:222 start_codon:yes stop_codon:yes gene_type:complete